MLVKHLCAGRKVGVRIALMGRQQRRPQGVGATMGMYRRPGMGRRGGWTLILLVPMLALLLNISSVWAGTGSDCAVAADLVVETAGVIDPASLSGMMRDVAARHSGDYGIHLMVVETGEEAGYQSDRPFYAASCYKLFLTMYIYENAAAGRIDLSGTITYQAGDRTDGTGIIQFMPTGRAFTVRQLCEYAIVYSDNVAAKMLKRVYGYHAFRDYAASIGCPVTGTYGLDLTTAREMCIGLNRVLQFAAANPLGQEVIDFLRRSIYKSRIPAGLPAGVEVGNKTGEYGAYLNDAAVVFEGDVTYLLCVLSSGASGDAGHVEVSRNVYNAIAGRCCGGGHCETGTTAPGTAWYFAEGTTRRGFETYLCLANPGEEEARAVVTAMDQYGQARDFALTISPVSRVSLNMNSLAGPELDIALRVTSTQPILAERPVYFRYQGKWSGGHCTAGVAAPGTAWYFAEGTTRPGFDTYLCLANPGEEEARAVVTAMDQYGQARDFALTISPVSRVSLLMNGLVGPDLDIALHISSDQPILAERPVYFDYRGQWPGGHCTVGVAAPGTAWYFAEGTTRPGFDTYLCLANPGEEEARADVEYLFGAEPAVKRTYTVPAGSRFSLSLNQEVGEGRDVSVAISSDVPILAERPMYFRYAARASGGHCVNGVAAASPMWYFAEGCSRDGFDMFLCIGNPNPLAAAVSIAFLDEAGRQSGVELTMAPASRTTLRVNDLVGGEHDISAVVSSDSDIVVERPMYFLFASQSLAP
jgi:beta-lactamase class A